MAPMKATYPRVSFADLATWPEDGRRYELYDGEVYEVPSPLAASSDRVGASCIWLSPATSVSMAGSYSTHRFDIVLTEYDVVQPDLLLFTHERQHLVIR